MRQTPQCFSGDDLIIKRIYTIYTILGYNPLCTHPFPSHTNIGIYNKCTNEQTLNKHIRWNRPLQFTFK